MTGAFPRVATFETIIVTREATSRVLLYGSRSRRALVLLSPLRRIIYYYRDTHAVLARGNGHSSDFSSGILTGLRGEPKLRGKHTGAHAIPLPRAISILLASKLGKVTRSVSPSGNGSWLDCDVTRSRYLCAARRSSMILLERKHSRYVLKIFGLSENVR